MTKAVSDLLEEFKERFGKYPNVAQFEEGKEFYNVGVRDLLTKNNIEYFSTNSERKAAIVERFNRTLKTSMWKYFYSKGTHTWIACVAALFWGRVSVPSKINKTLTLPQNSAATQAILTRDMNLISQNNSWIPIKDIQSLK